MKDKKNIAIIILSLFLVVSLFSGATDTIKEARIDSCSELENKVEGYKQVLELDKKAFFVMGETFSKAMPLAIEGAYEKDEVKMTKATELFDINNSIMGKLSDEKTQIMYFYNL